MDSKQEYVDGLDFYVRMVGERKPERIIEYQRERMQNRVESEDTAITGGSVEWDELQGHHTLNEDVPIDGQVTFYFPDRLDDTGADADGALSYTFPFRDHRKDDAPWEARPEAEEFSNHPVWKWENPEEDPEENLTLSPSLGIGGDDLTFHCFIRGGEIEWL